MAKLSKKSGKSSAGKVQDIFDEEEWYGQRFGDGKFQWALSQKKNDKKVFFACGGCGWEMRLWE